MSNQLVEARIGKITDALRGVAAREGVEAEDLRESVASGKAIVLLNNRRKNSVPRGVGEGLSIKVNANIGTSPERVNVEDEIEKLRTAEAAGADAIMDLSTGGILTRYGRSLCPTPPCP